MTTTQVAAAPTRTVDSVAERIFANTLATAETMSIYLGERLGWYHDLHQNGPATASELARRTGTNERYALEWLEMQGAFSILEADLSVQPTRFSISPEVAECLLDEHSLAYLGALPRMFAASFTHLPELLQAYRDGGGLSWEALGPDAFECQAALNRPWFEQKLAPALAGVEQLHWRLSRPGVQVGDIGCGGGWSTIALARAYPEGRFVGIDVDSASIDLARANAAEAGVGDRITFQLADGDTAEHFGPFDVAFAFECVHDMPRPVEVLAAVRSALGPEGSLVVMDEAVSERFTGPADELDRLMYGFSLFVCLPDGMSSQPSRGTGTVMRPATLRGYATEAGYERVDVLDINDFGFFRFYELHTH